MTREDAAGKMTGEEAGADLPEDAAGKTTDVEKADVRSMSHAQLEAFIASCGQPRYRAGQIFRWIHQKMARDFDEMTDLPAALREKLKEKAFLTVLTPVQVLTSRVDGTKKILFELPDRQVIESVFMRYHHGNSVCISSQVGCRMGCRFCASTIGGRVRNLTAAEMLEEVSRIRMLTNEKISNVVIMGSGEPLDNYDALLRFLELICDPEGMNLSRRSITVSTCGIVENIRRLADDRPGVTLALSLHASSQEKRRELMPIAEKYRLEDVLEACRYYFSKTGRRVTFEYSLVRGVNDTPEDAAALAKLLHGMNGHVNLIPVNPVKERSFKAPDRAGVEAFRKRLEKSGINATVRREMGRDISGACGQLRRGYLNAGIE